ncbi:MAG: DUF58 domain-containing protein [Defluviitaleaceae bacterium]|nr:DUF58 domain-containing protein [Defluviitaleaceae bacterium]
MLRNRLAYGMTVIVLMLLVFVYEHTMTYMALYAVLLLPLLSFVLTIATRKNFTVTESLSQNSVLKGQTISYLFDVKNNSFLPCTSVQVCFSDKTAAIETEFVDKFFSIMPFKNYQVTFDLTAKYRGTYEIGVGSIILYDFLGLFSFKQLHEEKITLNVLPSIVSLGALPLDSSNQGNNMSKNFNQDEDYSVISDLRKYHPSDGYKKIHWKMSARKNELVSKNFQGTHKNSVTVLLDNSVTNLPPEQKMPLEDSIMEACVSVLNYVHNNMYTMSLYYMSGPEQGEEGDFDYLYHIASKLQFVDTSFQDFFYNYSKMQVDTDNLVVFVQSITDNVFSTLQALTMFGNNVILFYFQEEDTEKIAYLRELKRLSCFSFKDLAVL